MRIRVGVIALCLALGALVGTAVARSTTSERQIDPKRRYKVPTDGAYFLGPRHAKVTIVQFTDLECPSCATAHDAIRTLMTKHKGDLRVVVRHYPLAAIHKNAELAARAAIAAGIQGKLPHFLRATYKRHAKLSRDAVLAAAKEAGLDTVKLQTDMSKPEVARMLARDYTTALRFGVRGTPTFFINGVPLVGMGPDLEKIVRRELSAATALIAGGTPVDRVYAQRVKGGMEEAAFAASGEPDIEPVNGRRWNVPIDGAPARGAENAPVTLVEFGDFQCPFCAAANVLVEKIRETFPNDVRVVWRNFPLAVHNDAAIAAEAGQAANAQGRFWAMHDAMFRERVRLDRSVLARIASELRLDTYRFNEDLEKHKYLPVIETDLKEVTETLGATGTPTFFINGRRVKGAQRFEIMREIIKEEIQRASLLRKGSGKAEGYHDLSQSDDALAAVDELRAAEQALAAGKIDDAEMHTLNAIGLAGGELAAASTLMVRVRCAAKDAVGAKEAASRVRGGLPGEVVKACSARGIAL